jgi:hypothetical protein
MPATVKPSPTIKRKFLVWLRCLENSLYKSLGAHLLDKSGAALKFENFQNGK